MIADLHNLAADAGSYYNHGAQMHPGSGAHYGNSHHTAPSGYYAPQQPTSYAPVYYGVGGHTADIGQHNTYDTRKRTFDALNEFFGDAKRRQIDPTSYQQVGQRLMALQGIPIHGGGISDYIQAAPSLVSVDGHGGHHSAPMPQHHQYALPLPNLRTKNDLMNIDHFLEQMQSTVYESSNAAAAAGIQQPVNHYTHAGLNFRQSHSPPQTALHHSHLGSHVSSAHITPSMVATNSSQSTSSGTPALTPPSSSVSYTSGHSPVSSHGMSPTSRHSSTATTAYPNLPAVTLGYSPHSTTAPASTLGTNFDTDPRRRYSGGMLQRSANPDRMDVSDDSATPSPRLSSAPRPEIIRSEVTHNIDPALSGISSPAEASDSGESARDRAEEAWLENIRVVEALRQFIGDRLRGESILMMMKRPIRT